MTQSDSWKNHPDQFSEQGNHEIFRDEFSRNRSES